MALQPARGAGSPIRRPAPHKWIFTKEEMKNTASMKEGMSREEEMNFRQMAAAFIQEMIDGLNNVKDPKMRIGHTCLCAAHTHMHRFYYWHSFKKFDYRDVAAACVFLAGKSQESPRKLNHVVQVWRDKRDRKQLTTETARAEAAQVIVLLESMILQTIAFDLNIVFPHTMILDILKRVDKDNHYKALATCAYYFATDVIAVTDWSLRFSSSSISIAVIQLVAIYANVKIEKLFASIITENSPWYATFDKDMKADQLRDMQEEFMNLYQPSVKFHHASKLNFPDHSRHHQQIENSRRADRSRGSNSPMVHPSPQEYARPRGYVPKDELTVDRLNKERQHEEERRKRDHDRMSGRIDHSSSSEKRARIDPLSSNFVTSNNGKHSLIPPPIPPILAPPIPTGHRNPTNRRTMPSDASSTSSSPFRPNARAFEVAPILTPPVQPKMASTDNSDMDLEDGELE